MCFLLCRFDILLDDMETGPTSTLQHNNPRKRLQFLSLDDVEGNLSKQGNTVLYFFTIISSTLVTAA